MRGKKTILGLAFALCMRAQAQEPVVVTSEDLTAIRASVEAMGPMVQDAIRDNRQATLWVLGAILATIAVQHMMFHRKGG